MVTPHCNENSGGGGDINKIVSKLLLGSTASIVHNLGFTTAARSSLDVLNSLLIKFYECMSRDVKQLSEHGFGCGTETTTINDAFLTLEQTAGFSLLELNEYMQSVGHFPSTSSTNPLPLIPVQRKSNVLQPADESAANFTAFNSTCPIESAFPVYVNKTATELHLVRDWQLKCSDKMDETLDSLASPILDLRRRNVRKRPSPCRERQIGQKVPKLQNADEMVEKCSKEEAEERKEKPLKSVLSNQGMKLRLLNKNTDTPPGFFLSRSKITRSATRRGAANGNI